MQGLLKGKSTGTNEVLTLKIESISYLSKLHFSQTKTQIKGKFNHNFNTLAIQNKTIKNTSIENKVLWKFTGKVNPNSSMKDENSHSKELFLARKLK